MSFGKKLVEFLAGGTVEEKVEETKEKISNDSIIQTSQEQIRQLDKKQEDEIKERRETDTKFKEDYDEALEAIRNIGRWGLNDYYPVVLEFLELKKGKKYTVNEIYIKLTSQKWLSKHECLKMVDKEKVQEACTYLWQEDEIEKTGNHKYYLED